MEGTEVSGTDILDEIVIHVDEKNEKDISSKLLAALFGSAKPKNVEENVSGQSFFEKLLKCIPKPFTIIHEKYHIDSSYRDTYYMYFSNQHFEVSRYSRRFSFFIGIIEYVDFIDRRDDNDDLNSRFIGACVINPVSGGLIGRTLINPFYVIEKKKGPVYLRVSEYTFNILGQQLRVNAFPFRMQDQETMTCAEVTLLNILEHYSNSYTDYRNVNPSEVISAERIHSNERVLPAKGITYPILTKVLTEFGFSPRLYNVFAIKPQGLSNITPRDELKRWIHYYIESGIPVAINTSDIKRYGNGHSVICIGHGNANEELKRKAKANELLIYKNREKLDHAIINSADFFDEYVIIDDNQFLYQVRKFDALTLHQDMQVVNFAAPLYKRMFLDAPDAADIITAILQHKEYGISEWADGYLEKGESVIIRIFMASSRSFKNFRVNTLPGYAERMLYSNMRLPRFIWVCELYRLKEYETNKAFGEIVIDATSARHRGHRSLLMMHYPSAIAVRNPDDQHAGFTKEYRPKNRKLYYDPFCGYQKNLTRIDKLENGFNKFVDK